MRETLYPYQSQGAEWLASKAQAFLADDMGVGKSAQAVRATDLVDARRVLVVCPASLRTNWCREFDRFSPHPWRKVPVFSGQSVKHDLQQDERTLVVVSYDLAAQPWLSSVSWDVLILDEAHYLKTRTTKRTKAIYGHGKRPGLISQAKRVWRLSGTPAPNYANELWTQFKSMGLLEQGETYYDFEGRYCKTYQAPFGTVITGHRNTAELKQRLHGVFLRRKKDDVLKDLPPIYWHQVTVDKHDLDLPKDLVREALEQDNLLGRRIDAKDFDSLMSQAASYATLRRYTAWAKVHTVAEILAEDLAADPACKIVVFGVHSEPLRLLATKLHDYFPLVIMGDTPVSQRQGIVDAFQNDPEKRVVIGNVIAAGTGITLTASCEVAFLEQDWVPGNNLQAAMRCHRIGQDRRVRVRVFALAGSCDEQVQDMLVRKSRELNKIDL